MEITKSKVNLAISLVGVVIYSAILTSGFTKIGLDGFSSLHDHIAEALLQLRLDTTDLALSGEAFIVGDKMYSYFGLTPALLRLPIHLFFHYLNFSLLYCFAGFLILSLEIFAILKKSNPWIFTCAIIFATGLSQATSTYYESILWGLNFSLLAFLFFKKEEYFISLIFVFFATHSRATMGAGLIIYFVLDAYQNRDSVRASISLSTFYFLLGSIYLSVLLINFLKFGNYSPLPSQHVQNWQVPLQVDSYTNLSYLPNGILTYLFSPGHVFHNEFRGVVQPFLEQYTDFRRAHIVIDEVILGLIYFPLLWFCVSFSIANFPRSYPLIASFGAVFIFLCTFGGISHRYVFDLFPLIIFAISAIDIKPSKYQKIYMFAWILFYIAFEFSQRGSYVMGYMHH
jgi:hypothetical protein